MRVCQFRHFGTYRRILARRQRGSNKLKFGKPAAFCQPGRELVESLYPLGRKEWQELRFAALKRLDRTRHACTRTQYPAKCSKILFAERTRGR